LSVCPPSAEVFFPAVDTDEEMNISREIDEFMSELNGEEVEMNLDARRILTTANAPSSRRKYASKQAEYVQWLEKEGVDASQPNAMINYIMILNNKYSPGSLWSTYLILKKWYKIEKNINIKDWTLVADLLKVLTKNHVVKKSKTFTKNKFAALLKGVQLMTAPR